MDATPAETLFEVVGGAPELWGLNFKRNEVEVSPHAQPGNITFTVTFARSHKRHLGVQLWVGLQGLDWAQVSITFRVSYVVRGVISDEGLKEVLRMIGLQLGPNTLFPFVREALLSITQKSGGGAVLLPLVNWNELLGESSLEVPETDVEAPPELLAPIRPPNDNANAG